MKHHRSRSVVLFFLAILATAGIFLYFQGNALLHATLEKSLNRSVQEVFSGSLRFSGVSLTHDLKIRLEDIRGDLQTMRGPVPLEVRSLESRNSLINLAFQKPLLFGFEGLRPASSVYEGMHGEAEMLATEEWYFEMRAETRELGVEDIRWLNPGALEDADGKLAGNIYFRNDYKGNMDLRTEADVKEPGGNLQAHFFDLLTPYLPQVKEKIPSAVLAEGRQTVAYKRAHFTITMPAPDRIKMFLNLLVPEYNLDLNLNLEIRLDKKNAFLELAEELGRIEVTI